MKSEQWFLRPDVKQHVGEWVAILNNKVIGHNKSGKALYEEVSKRNPGEHPLFMRVPDSKPICY